MMFFPKLTSIDGTLYADGTPYGGKLKLIEHGALPKILTTPELGHWGQTLSPLIADAENRVVCFMASDGDVDREMRRANQIAAAPELLHELNRARAFIREVVDGKDWEGCAGREIVIDCDAAIAKAEGR